MSYQNIIEPVQKKSKKIKSKEKELIKALKKLDPEHIKFIVELMY